MLREFLAHFPGYLPWDCAKLQSSQLTSKGMPHGSMGGAAAAGCTERGKPLLPALLPCVLCHRAWAAGPMWGGRWRFLCWAQALCPRLMRIWQSAWCQLPMSQPGTIGEPCHCPTKHQPLGPHPAPQQKHC